MRGVIALSFMCLIGGGVKPDRRLLGKWKSDKEATLQIINRFRDNSHMAPDKLAVFADIFGKLVVEYSSSTIRSHYEDHVEVIGYEVVARDEDSVVLRSYDALMKKDQLSLIRFAGPDRYRLYAPGMNFPEVFRRTDGRAVQDQPSANAAGDSEVREE